MNRGKKKKNNKIHSYAHRNSRTRFEIRLYPVLQHTLEGGNKNKTDTISKTLFI